MKVAIIGAGVSGLACGLELERQGITPDIYEQRYYSGEPYPLVSTMLDMGMLPQEPTAYLKKQQLTFTPLGPINSLIIHSPHNQFRLEGNLGYFVAQGQGDQSLCAQWEHQLKTKIKFKQPGDYFKLKDKYDWVVIADGSPSTPILLNLWQANFQVFIRGASIVGNFNPKQAHIWFDREFAREGYAYLNPISEKTACLVLIVNGISRQELHDYWDTFTRKIPFQLQATGYFELEYQTGSVIKHQLGNTLLVGNAGGFDSLLFGQGITLSALSGIEAARAIAQQQDYQTRIKYLLKIKNMLDNRQKKLSTLNNRGLDLLLTASKIFGFKHSNKLIKLISATKWGKNKGDYHG